MSSPKKKILEKLRANQPPASPLPDLAEDGIRYADPFRQFADVLASVGGQARSADNIDSLQQQLQQLEPYRQASRICSLVEGVAGNVDLRNIDDPHDLQDIDFCVAPGQFAVAENGAVWVTDEAIRHRVVLFIAQHLALVVSRSQIVDNMHQAYRRTPFGSRQFGVFISGPSKTADIEQSLVIGAHGARSTSVFLLGETE